MLGKLENCKTLWIYFAPKIARISNNHYSEEFPIIWIFQFSLWTFIVYTSKAIFAAYSWDRYTPEKTELVLNSSKYIFGMVKGAI